MELLEKISKRFEKKNETTFSIESESPELEIGGIHEDNKWFHGTKFEILSVTDVKHHPEERWPYTINGTCRVLEKSYK